MTADITGGKLDKYVIYEDGRVIVLNKPAGISMHGKNPQDEAETVESKFRSKLAKNDTTRGGIVHRLDKDTSGVVIMAKTEPELEFLQSQFADREVDKKYIALVWGHLKHPRARIELPIKRSTKAPNRMSIDANGKMSISDYEVISEYLNFSLLRFTIHTGRTHQIRVQLAHMGHPVVGDRLYGGRPTPKGLSRQFLHAELLALKLGESEERTTFRAPLPDDLKNYMDTIDA